MRKILSSILSIFALACILTLAIPGMVIADAPTSVVVNWNGGGTVTGVTTAGTSATYSFATTGNQVAGSFTANDLNNNPYNYGVDSTNSYINADVIGGSISYSADRTGSYPMYGVAGQVASSFVGVNADGLGEMATGSTNNFAAMVNGTYGQSKTSGGYNYEASGTGYLIQSYIGIGPLGAPIDGNYAFVQSAGTGTSKVNDMTNQQGSQAR